MCAPAIKFLDGDAFGDKHRRWGLGVWQLAEDREKWGVGDWVLECVGAWGREDVWALVLMKLFGFSQEEWVSIWVGEMGEAYPAVFHHVEFYSLAL